MSSHEAMLRQRKIIEDIRKFKQVRVNALAADFGVSAVTIRNDLDELAGQGLLRRTHGGAVEASPVRLEHAIEVSSQENAAAKQAIGHAAANLIRSGDTIILDVGSTTTELAKALPDTLQDVTVVTNGLNIALLLERHPGITVIVTGGTLRALQHSLVNPYATRILQEINADKAFLGCNGVDITRGFTNTNVHEADIKHTMTQAARSVIFLADSSKIGHTSTARIAPLNVADELITDEYVSPEHVQALQANGLKVSIAF